MSNIDWGVAAHIKPQTSQDFVAPLMAFANLQLAQSRAQELQMQMRQQNAQFGARNQLQGYIDQGMDLPTALVKSNYGAFDPTGATALQNASRQQVEYLARQKYANTGDINTLAPIGAGEVETASKIPQTQQAIQIARINAIGNVATGFLADRSEEARAAAVGRVRDLGGLNELQTHHLLTMPLDQFTQLARNFAGMGEKSVTTSGIAGYNEGLSKAATQIEKASPTETLNIPPGAAQALQPGFKPGGTNVAVADGQPQPGQIFTRSAAIANGYSPQGLVGAKLMESGSGAAPNVDPQTNGPAGPLQFDAATWRRFGDGDLKNRFDIEKSLIAAQRMAAANRPVLAKILGHEPTDAQLYVGHQQGVAGGPALYAHPDARAADVLSAAGTNGVRAVIGNGGDPNWSAKQFTDFLENRFNNKIGATGSFAVTGPRPGGPLNQMAMPAAMNPQLGQITPGMPIGTPAIPLQAAPPIQAALTGLAPSSGPVSGGEAPTPTPGAAPIPVVPPNPQGVLPPGVTAAPTGLPADRAAQPLLQTTPAAQPQGGYQRIGGMTPMQEAQQRAQGELNVKQTSEAREAFLSAQDGQFSLQQLDQQLDKIPPGGGKGVEVLLAPGTGATERIGFAKLVNTIAESAGRKPWFDPAKIAAAEDAQKITGRLGFQLARATEGSRGVASIVQQAVSLNPGLENTPQGAKLISASLNAGLQREKDFYVFQQRYAGQNGGSPQGAEIAFDRAYPVSHYVAEAERLTHVNQDDVEILRGIAGHPRAAAEFDRIYGAGMSRYFVGAQ